MTVGSVHAGSSESSDIARLAGSLGSHGWLDYGSHKMYGVQQRLQCQCSKQKGPCLAMATANIAAQAEPQASMVWGGPGSFQALLFANVVVVVLAL
jgi:hypothetical protein